MPYSAILMPSSEKCISMELAVLYNTVLCYRHPILQYIQYIFKSLRMKKRISMAPTVLLHITLFFSPSYHTVYICI